MPVLYITPVLSDLSSPSCAKGTGKNYNADEELSYLFKAVNIPFPVIIVFTILSYNPTTSCNKALIKSQLFSNFLDSSILFRAFARRYCDIVKSLSSYIISLIREYI